MKLKIDAKALLTVGPKLGKDKFMQAAGRMRQLGTGQQMVAFLGNAEVERQIREVCHVDGSARLKGVHVVQWTMHNTIVSVALEGMPEWAKQGVHFAFTHGRPQYAVLDEKLRLQELYGRRFLNQSAMDVLASSIDDFKAGCKGKSPSDKHLQKIIDDIQERVKASKMAGDKVLSTGLDEECERELEKETEIEVEEEAQIKKRTPVAETDWADYNCVFSVGSAESLGGALQLDKIISARFDPQDMLSEIAWQASVPAGAIYMTRNFVNTVVDENVSSTSTSTGIVAQYLRPVDNVLVFQGAPSRGFTSAGCSVLLLSEREADKILGLLWEKGVSPRERTPCLANLTYLRLAKTHPPQLISRGLSDPGVACSLLVTLQLFNGDTAYCTEEQKARLQQMMASPRAKLAALKIPVMRGLQFMVSHSDLEVASKS